MYLGGNCRWPGAPEKTSLAARTKNEKFKDYCKADLKQRVLFSYNKISAGHTSIQFRFTDVTELM